MSTGFSTTRLRRLRKNAALRTLFQETEFNLSDLILPIFVEEEVDDFGVIESMPGVLRIPEARLAGEIDEIDAIDGVSSFGRLEQVVGDILVGIVDGDEPQHDGAPGHALEFLDFDAGSGRLTVSRRDRLGGPQERRCAEQAQYRDGYCNHCAHRFLPSELLGSGGEPPRSAATRRLTRHCPDRCPTSRSHSTLSSLLYEFNKNLGALARRISLGRAAMRDATPLGCAIRSIGMTLAWKFSGGRSCGHVQHLVTAMVDVNRALPRPPER